MLCRKFHYFFKHSISGFLKKVYAKSYTVIVIVDILHKIWPSFSVISTILIMWESIPCLII